MVFSTTERATRMRSRVCRSSFLAPWTELKGGAPGPTAYGFQHHGQLPGQSLHSLGFSPLLRRYRRSARTDRCASNFNVSAAAGKSVRQYHKSCVAAGADIVFVYTHTHTHMHTAEWKRSSLFLAILSAPECELRNSGKRAAVFIP